MKSVRIAIALLALVVGIAAYVSSTPEAGAVIIVGPGVCTYYSGPNYKTAVGARGTGCCGTTINWGVTSPYVRCERLYCTDQICPN
ncbi:MAG TPA: DUF6289 family protein [Candidatus Polarisedimenticolaceae bacterium]|nr:DUF6289 family protein [Candidatus Polarisedimenticolaceae bacterium]